MPKFSVCEFTTPSLTFEEDLELYRSVGATGISICEVKLRPGEEHEQLAAFNDSGLKASVSIPMNIGVLNCDPWFPGPEANADRVQAMLHSIERLAPFEPEGILFITGSGTGLPVDEARQTAVDGLRTAARHAAKFGMNVGLEPLRSDGGFNLSLIETVEGALDILDEIGEPNVEIAYDLYHLWDAPNAVEMAHKVGSRVGGVHVSDWREPPRSIGDRLIPGDGPIPIAELCRALEDGGFEGWYELEIFSDLDLEGSLWKIDPRDLVQRSYERFMEAWNKGQQLA
jgi:sugar phosphate isomerase/epimerase